MPIDPEDGRAVGQGERNLGEAERLAGVAAIEDDVGHFGAAKGFGRLFAQDPAHGVEHV